MIKVGVFHENALTKNLAKLKSLMSIFGHTIVSVYSYIEPTPDYCISSE